MFFTFYPLATCVNCNSWVTVSSISPVLVLSGNVIFCPGMLAIHTIIRRLRHVLFFSALSHPLFVHLFVPPIPGSLLHCITPIIPSFHEVCLQRVRYSSVNVEWTNDWPTCCVSVSEPGPARVFLHLCGCKERVSQMLSQCWTGPGPNTALYPRM